MNKFRLKRKTRATPPASPEEQRVGQGKGANASGVNRQGLKPDASYWMRLEKEIRKKDAILYGRKI